MQSMILKHFCFYNPLYSPRSLPGFRRGICKRPAIIIHPTVLESDKIEISVPIYISGAGLSTPLAGKYAYLWISCFKKSG